ncbi:MAG: hypothetical protein RLZZ195_852 [Pseudomonadota bacterium]|jgi:hypothetical protein
MDTRYFSLYEPLYVPFATKIFIIRLLWVNYSLRKCLILSHMGYLDIYFNTMNLKSCNMKNLLTIIPLHKYMVIPNQVLTR